MGSKCCGLNLGCKSRSSSHIIKSHNLKSINSDLENANTSLVDLNLYDFNQNQELFCPSKDIDEDLSLEKANRKTSQDDAIDTKYDPNNIKLYLDQDINRIRSRNKLFDDPFFIKYISSIVENTESQLYISLKTRLKCDNLKELNKVIKWERTQVLNIPKI